MRMTASVLAACLALGPAAPASAAEIFRGEECRRCHDAIRDRAPAALDAKAAPSDAGSFDAVIVGGGTAGLVAAYHLRDFKVLLLDKEAKAGGKMRRESFNGDAYPVGAVYMGEPHGRLKTMFDALGLKVNKITLHEHTLHKDGRRVPDWVSGDASRMPLTAESRARFKEFQAELKRFGDNGRITLPVEECDPAALAEYDGVNFHDWLAARYGTEVADLGDLYSRDVFGISGREVSAAAGMLYMSSEVFTSYTFDGGLGAAPEALAKALGRRARTGAFVWRVAQDAGGATVDFHDGRKDYRARARAVVLAVPSMVAKRVVAGLSQPKREAMSKVRYSSYALVPMRFKKVVWNDAFVLWTPGMYFTDLTLPEYSPATLRGAKSQALVAYIPMGEKEGRAMLLSAKDEDMVSGVLADLGKVLPGAPAEVVETRVIRWGHAMPVPFPGYLTTVRPALAAPEGRFFFAGVDTQLPAIEGAVNSGILAAEGARKLLKASARVRR